MRSERQAAEEPSERRGAQIHLSVNFVRVLIDDKSSPKATAWREADPVFFAAPETT